MRSGTRFPENMWGGIKRNFFRMGLLYYYYHHRRRCFLPPPSSPLQARSSGGSNKNGFFFLFRNTGGKRQQGEEKKNLLLSCAHCLPIWPLQWLFNGSIAIGMQRSLSLARTVFSKQTRFYFFGGREREARARF